MGETPFGGAGKSLGATVRPEESKSRQASAMKRQAPTSDGAGIPRCLAYSSVGRMSMF